MEAFRRRDSHALLTLDWPRMASGLAIEAAWATAHMMMYPLDRSHRQLGSPAGAVTISEALNPEQRGLFHHDVDAAETPILLVHGIIDNHAIFTVMERALRRRGFQTLSTYDYGLLTHNIAHAAARLGRPSRSCPRQPATNESTSSATAWVASSPATTCNGWEATITYTHW